MSKRESGVAVTSGDIGITQAHLRKWRKSAKAKGNAETAAEIEHVMRTFSALWAEAKDRPETAEAREIE